jgi:DNA repair photolyase
MYEYDEIASMSLAAIKMLNSYGIKCTVLTKGLLPIELAKCSSENEYGITIISLDESYRIRVEPGAANYENRISALKKLSDLGRRTWASIEPYPTPNLINQDLSKLLDEIGFVDKIVFGRTNYNKQVSAFPGYKEYYNEQAHRVIDFCNQKQIQVHIKTGTLTE